MCLPPCWALPSQRLPPSGLFHIPPADGRKVAKLVRRAAGGIEGIVNGMDTDDWCPTVDKFLDVKYDERTVAHGKAAAKETLQAELGLPVRPSPIEQLLRAARLPADVLIVDFTAQPQQWGTPSASQMLSRRDAEAA